MQKLIYAIMVAVIFMVPAVSIAQTDSPLDVEENQDTVLGEGRKCEEVVVRKVNASSLIGWVREECEEEKTVGPEGPGTAPRIVEPAEEQVTQTVESEKETAPAATDSDKGEKFGGNVEVSVMGGGNLDRDAYNDYVGGALKASYPIYRGENGWEFLGGVSLLAVPMEGAGSIFTVESTKFALPYDKYGSKLRLVPQLGLGHQSEKVRFSLFAGPEFFSGTAALRLEGDLEYRFEKDWALYVESTERLFSEVDVWQQTAGFLYGAHERVQLGLGGDLQVINEEGYDADVQTGGHLRFRISLDDNQNWYIDGRAGYAQGGPHGNLSLGINF